MSTAPASAVPEGFKPFQISGPFALSCGPFYYRREAGDDFRYGFAAEERHANPYGEVHGGDLVTFADTFMGRTVVAAAKCACATITLNTEFMAGGAPGDWVEGKAEVSRLTRSLAFLRADVSSGGTLLMTVSGVWRLFPERSAVDGGRRPAEEGGG